MRRFLALISILFASLPLGILAQSATPGAGIDPAAYCVEKGGTVVHRTPALGTNNPANMLVLGGGSDFCQFADGPLDEMSTSRISIDIRSFASTEPTMAVLAYLTKPPVPTSNNGANPASLYCAHLGGMEIGSTTALGGGWVTEGRGNDLDVLEACTFPDGSIIDSWGITYHANGTVRGADLTPLLGYQSSDPPIIFPER
jgi:putative hemolysin